MCSFWVMRQILTYWLPLLWCIQRYIKNMQELVVVLQHLHLIPLADSPESHWFSQRSRSQNGLLALVGCVLWQLGFLVWWRMSSITLTMALLSWPDSTILVLYIVVFLSISQEFVILGLLYPVNVLMDGKFCPSPEPLSFPFLTLSLVEFIREPRLLGSYGDDFSFGWCMLIEYRC